MSSPVFGQSPFSENSKTENIERLLAFQRDLPNMFGIDTSGFDLLLDGIIDGILLNYGRDRLCDDRMPDVEDLRARMHNIDEEVKTLEEELLSNEFSNAEIIGMLDFLFLDGGEKVVDRMINFFDGFDEGMMDMFDPENLEKKLSDEDAIYLDNIIALYGAILGTEFTDIIPEEDARMNMRIFLPSYQRTVDLPTLIKAVDFFKSPIGTKHIDLQGSLFEASLAKWEECQNILKARYDEYEKRVAYSVEYSNRILYLEKQLMAEINNYTIASVHRSREQQRQQFEAIEHSVKTARKELFEMSDCFGNEELRDVVYGSYNYFYEAILFSRLSEGTTDCEILCYTGDCFYCENFIDLNDYLNCNRKDEVIAQAKWDSLGVLMDQAYSARERFADQNKLCLVPDEIEFYDTVELINNANAFVNNINTECDNLLSAIIAPQIYLCEIMQGCGRTDTISYEELTCLKANIDTDKFNRLLVESRRSLIEFKRDLATRFRYEESSKEAAVIRRITAKTVKLDSLLNLTYPMLIRQAIVIPSPNASDYPLVEMLNQVSPGVIGMRNEIIKAFNWYYEAVIPKEYLIPSV